MPSLLQSLPSESPLEEQNISEQQPTTLKTTDHESEIQPGTDDMETDSSENEDYEPI